MSINPDDITPSLPSIASYIPTRTMDANNRPQGTFTDDTRPTASEVQIVARRAAGHLSLELGTPYSSWDGSLTERATDVAALYAALQIETGWFGEGSGQESAAMDQLGRMYREQIEAIKVTARDNQVGGRRMHSVRIVSAGRRKAQETGP